MITERKKRVLIVDDEAGFTHLLKLNLHHTGLYIAEAVNDPVNAVAAAKEFSPDVILLDVMMPGMAGGDVAAQILASPKLKDTPIIFLTAAVKRSELAAHHGTIGGALFLAKPVELHQVLRSIEQSCLGPR